MLFYIFPKTDAVRNLATEEFFFLHKKEPCFLLWRNESAVIVGRNQNTLAEINTDYVRRRGISVVRRMTGGGAVFHDLGNLNYTFISRDEPGNDIDFQTFTRPIIDALSQLGIDARLNGRNDLCIDGLKFSGNAQTRNAHGTLHHGTLLFSSNVADISGALQVDPRKIQSKGIASVASRVTNISAHLPAPMDILQFAAFLGERVCTGFPHTDIYEPTVEDEALIDRLVAEKYGTWEWNYGYSPAYTHTKSQRFSFGTVEVGLQVKDGKILSAAVRGDFFGTGEIGGLQELLVGCEHREEALRQRLTRVELNTYIFGMTVPQLLSLLV
ncbi:MAG: lipoate--protein ligase [Clostridia bacterium]|nr:lipoate--protein ligase [Clostridia bacterium]